MRIGQRITLLLSLMALIVGGLSVIDVSEAWKRKTLADDTQQSTQTIDLLLTAAGHWAVERGVTNSGLSAPVRANADVLKTIEERRNKGTAAYKAAMEFVDTHDFVDKDYLMPKLEAAYAKANALREGADQALLVSKENRDSTLLKDWVPAMSDLIVLTQDIRFSIARETAAIDPEVGRQSDMKHFLWLMSEFAGRERAIIGGMIAAGESTPATLQKLANFRGRVETSWHTVEELRTGSRDDVLGKLREMEKTFFGPYQDVRASMYDAANNGESLPLTTQQWIGESTNAINTILAAQRASVEETEAYVSGLRSDANTQLVVSGLILLIAAGVAGFAFWSIFAQVVTPINQMTLSMNTLAGGEVSVEIPSTERSDEIGEMAASVQTFKDNLIETDRLRKEQDATKQQADMEREKAMLALADKFELSVGGVVNAVTSAADELQSTAQSMSATAEETTSQSGVVAAAADEMTQNVQTAASATEQLAASIGEISQQVGESTNIVSDAVRQAEDTNAKVTDLSDAADKIGDVITLITEIAEQTNLLALNATIEAARAGEAGKGFAVVASEVKNLANQTAKATIEIGDQVRNIRQSTGDAASAIDAIAQTISRVSEISTAIASAVEEQGAATQDISRNVQQAAAGASEVSTNVSSVTQASQETSAGSTQVLGAASELAQNGAALKKEVDEFLREIRTG